MNDASIIDVDYEEIDNELHNEIEKKKASKKFSYMLDLYDNFNCCIYNFVNSFYNEGYINSNINEIFAKKQ